MYQITNQSTWAQIAWTGVQNYFINGGVAFGDAVNQRVLLEYAFRFLSECFFFFPFSFSFPLSDA
jgi:hypothetical protein